MSDDPDRESVRHLADSVLAQADTEGLLVALHQVEARGSARVGAKVYQELVKRFYQERRDLPRMLMVGTAAVRFCLGEAAKLEATDGAGAQHLRNAAKVIAFNVGANSWPGWKDEGIEPEPSAQAMGLEMALLSLGLVPQLRLGANQLGNGYWLVGAHWMAAREFKKALEAFAEASRESDDAGNQSAAFMAKGYSALTDKLAAPAETNSFDALQGALRELVAEGSDDAKAYAAQIETAHAVFFAQ